MRALLFRRQALHYLYECLPYTLAASFTLALLVYAVTRAFVWDEGFHLIAAQMIANGKRPYLDFCFPQTPLNAYWNALLLKAFGHGWRVIHVFAALFVGGTAFLLAQYLRCRVPAGPWRIPTILTSVAFLALTPIVVQFGPIAQAYGMGLAAAFLAFRFWTISRERTTLVVPVLSGLAAGVAAGATLLTAPLLPVLFVAFLLPISGDGLRKASGFLLGSIAPFAPVFSLFVANPHNVFFNVVQYQALFRRYHWDNPGPHDFDVLTSWVESNQTFLLLVFALVTIGSLARSRGDGKFRRELLVAAALAVSMGLYISTAHPTFSRYYVVEMPFLALLAGPGMQLLGARLLDNKRASAAIAFLAFVLLVTIARMLFNDRDSATFARYRDIAKKVAEVNPAHKEYFADETVYFMLNQTPPPGMEFSYSHKLELPAAEERRLHIISEKELQAQLKAGRFGSYQTCKDDQIDDWGIEKIFSHKAEIEDCTVFWGYHK